MIKYTDLYTGRLHVIGGASVLVVCCALNSRPWLLTLCIRQSGLFKWPMCLWVSVGSLAVSSAKMGETFPCFCHTSEIQREKDNKCFISETSGHKNEYDMQWKRILLVVFNSVLLPRGSCWLGVWGTVPTERFKKKKKVVILYDIPNTWMLTDSTEISDRWYANQYMDICTFYTRWGG